MPSEWGFVTGVCKNKKGKERLRGDFIKPQINTDYTDGKLQTQKDF